MELQSVPTIFRLPPLLFAILINTVRKLPLLNTWLQEREIGPCLALLKRPGRLQARLPLTPLSIGNFPQPQCWQHEGRLYTIYGNSYHLSPDAHALTMDVAEYLPNSHRSAESSYLALFRW